MQSHTIGSSIEKSVLETQSIGSSLPDWLRPNLARQVADLLANDETIVWIGRPDPKNMMSRCWSIYLIGFIMCLPFLGGVFCTPTQAFAQALLVVVLLISAIFVVFLPMYFYTIAQETVYLLTDRRAVLLEPRRKLEFKTVGRLEIVKRSERLSDIVFSHEYADTSNYGCNGTMPVGQVSIGFLAIEQADLVEEQLRKVFTVLIVRHDPPRDTDGYQEKF